MDKCREEFEKKFGIVGTRMPNGNYSSWAHQMRWDAFQSAWQHQQAKVEELQEQKSLQEMEINHLGQANQQWQSKCQELQKQYDQHDTWLLERNRDCNELYNISVKHVAEKAELQNRVDSLESTLKKCLLHGLDSVRIDGSSLITMREKIQQVLDGENNG